MRFFLHNVLTYAYAVICFPAWVFWKILFYMASVFHLPAGISFALLAEHLTLRRLRYQQSMYPSLSLMLVTIEERYGIHPEGGKTMKLWMTTLDDPKVFYRYFDHFQGQDAKWLLDEMLKQQDIGRRNYDLLNDPRHPIYDELNRMIYALGYKHLDKSRLGGAPCQ